MTSYDARLRLIGETALPMGVEVDLTDQRMVVTKGGTDLADWSLDEIRILTRDDGFLIEAEGEEIVLSVSNGLRFASEIGIDLNPV
jgi:hypothetical protein